MQNLINKIVSTGLFDKTTYTVILSTFGIKITDVVQLIDWSKTLTNIFVSVSIILAVINIIYKIKLMRKLKSDDK